MSDDGHKHYPLLDAFKQVVNFHKKFYLFNSDYAILPKGNNLYGQAARFIRGEDLRQLRRDLLEEEFQEYMVAESADDIAGVADALADIIVIALGTAASYGIPIHAVFEEVMKTNFAKLDENGRPRYREDGKLLKPEGWEEPNIKSILGRFHNGALIEAHRHQSSQTENPDPTSPKENPPVP